MKFISDEALYHEYHQKKLYLLETTSMRDLLFSAMQNSVYSNLKIAYRLLSVRISTVYFVHTSIETSKLFGTVCGPFSFLRCVR